MAGNGNEDNHNDCDNDNTDEEEDNVMMLIYILRILMMIIIIMIKIVILMMMMIKMTMIGTLMMMSRVIHVIRMMHYTSANPEEDPRPGHSVRVATPRPGWYPGGPAGWRSLGKSQLYFFVWEKRYSLSSASSPICASMLKVTSFNCLISAFNCLFSSRISLKVIEDTLSTVLASTGAGFWMREGVAFERAAALTRSKTTERPISGPTGNWRGILRQVRADAAGNLCFLLRRTLSIRVLLLRLASKLTKKNMCQLVKLEQII